MVARRNALWNCKNPNQGSDPKVLCVCSAGLLRSPTIAHVLNKHDYNVRCAGVHDYALVQVDEVLASWADIYVFADEEHYEVFKTKYNDTGKQVYVLNIPDCYEYKNPELVNLIEEKLGEIGLV